MICPFCSESLQIYKSKRKTVITVAHGAFEARETFKQCDRVCAPPIGSEALRELVRPGQRYGYDVIVHVGLGRYLLGRQRDEIRQTLIDEQGIHLSTGTISTLCDRFLALFEALHIQRAPQLRVALQDGYPLHIDATCDRGKGGLFVCMDGWRQWVLWAARVSSENADYLTPLVDKTVQLFGLPIAVVRDLGDAGANTVKHLRQQGVLDLVCHYHFLAAIGSKLFEALYDHLRGILRLTGIRTDMRTLLRDLRPYCSSSAHQGRFGPGRVRDELKALVLWVLEGDGKKDTPFPFSLPHFEFLRRCRGALQRAEQWVPCPRTQPERRAMRHLAGLVARPEKDTRLSPTVRELEERWRAFDELRNVLRLSNAELPRGDARYEPRQLPALELARLKKIKRAFEVYATDLKQRIPLEDQGKARPSSTYAIIAKYLDRYGDSLFGHPARLDLDGGVIAVVERTNNVLEHFFGKEKQRLRRRVGRAQLGRDLEQQPAQAALVSNLRSPDYVRVLCGSLENLPAVFATLDAQSNGVTAPPVRQHRNKALQRHVRQLLKNADQPAGSEQDEQPHSCPPAISAIDVADITAKEEDLEMLSNEPPCADVAKTSEPPRPQKPRDPRLPPPDSVLERWYKGRSYRVRILDDGFEFRGSRCDSLTHIASAITHRKRKSGFQFFSLTLPWTQRAARMRGRRISQTTLVDLASAN